MNELKKNGKLSIKNWSEDDRPREKLLNKGRTTLSEAELIAILIGSGNISESAVELSRRILSTVQNDLHKLSRLTVLDFQKFKGIGQAKAITIIAALELGRRKKIQRQLKNTSISTSREAYIEFYQLFQDLLHEEFWVMYLNKANKMIARFCISKGGITGTVADIRIIMKQAVEQLACSVILAHNHPSGNLKPSKADVELTEKVKSAALLMDIQLLDHLIIGNDGYMSFADEGLL